MLPLLRPLIPTVRAPQTEKDRALVERYIASALRCFIIRPIPTAHQDGDPENVAECMDEVIQ